MSNRTFRDIAKHGHPEDPQAWEAVDDDFTAVNLAWHHIGLALYHLEDMGQEPKDWIDRLVSVRMDLKAALSGEQEEAE